MSRFSTTLLLLMALLLAPALCVGGMIEHACDCGGEAELQCDHEDDCSGDLCSTFSLPSKEGHIWQLDMDLLWLPLQPTVVHLSWQETWRPSEALPLKRRIPPGLPYLPSDRPQLI